jgi:hypothetical protein
MEEKEEIKKTYLAPEYDDDDIDDDFDEDIDEDGEDEVMENFLDKQEKLNSSNKFNNNNNSNSMSTFGSNNPPTWGQSNNQSSWGNTSGNVWGNNNNPQNSNPWANNNNSSPWQRPNSGFTWGTGNGTSWGSSGIGEKKEIDRKKKVIICDVLDCLVETYQSNGKPGLLPRGIYDIKLRFDVWDKIACFNPDKIFAMVPRSLLNSSNGSDSWKVMLDYVVCSFSEYLRSPYQVCQILLQTRIGQPKEELIQQVLGNIAKESIIQIGVNSGLYGQNNRDQVAATICGIDYVDLGTFLSSYY